MKTFLKSLAAIGTIVLALLVVATPARAQECPDNLPVSHALGSNWTGLPEASLSGRAWVVSNPAINSGTAPFLRPSG